MNYEITRNGGSTLVLLPCSRKKVKDEGPAIEVYDVAGARIILRSVLDSGLYDERVDTYFISNHHGVIAVDEWIEAYDDGATEEDVPWLIEQVGGFLEDHDYEVMYGFVDGHYRRALDEIGYQRTTKWDIDTLMFRPHCRSASLDARDTLHDLLEKHRDIESAAHADW